MRVVRSAEVEQLAQRVPDEPGRLVPEWWEGPHDEGLSAGIVNMSPGGVTPPHVHLGGQVMFVTAGRGWVEAGGEHVDLGPGDVVVAPAGELHVHGAAEDSAFSHLNVTAGGYTFPANDES